LLTIEDLTNKLDIGKATLKFILYRFSPWLAAKSVNDETLYTEQAVTTLLKIQKLLDTGMLPEQVEDSLAQEVQIRKATPPAGYQAPTMDMEAVSVFKDMFQVYIEKQDRIACAQEELARIEERKADAMEKRAAAEEKKADAMTHIATALQEMNQRVSSVPQAMEIAGRAVENIALEELEESSGPDETLLDTDFDDNGSLFEDPGPMEMEDPFKDQDHEALGDFGAPNLDDLTLLVNETALTPDDIDDLSSLIDSVSDPAGDLGDLSSLLEEPTQESGMDDTPHDMDDLSILVDPDLSSSDTPEQKANHQTDHTEDNENDMDDLSILVDLDADDPKDYSEDIDDLSKRAEPKTDLHTDTLDDLSALIETPEQPLETMDDLSALVRETGEDSGRVDADIGEAPIDDLWSLVPDTPEASQGGQNREGPSRDHSQEMDDLSALVDQTSDEIHPSARTAPDDTINLDDAADDPDEAPSIKPDISPDQDMKKYKATVMKIIIELKEQGSTAQQTTDRLNRDNVATLSGKPAWGLKAIEKIYGFIDSAK
jgi:DNA-binding transcriptional MerR regulator